MVILSVVGIQVGSCSGVVLEQRPHFNIAAGTTWCSAGAIHQPLPRYTSSIWIYDIEPFDRAHLTLEPDRQRLYFFRFFRIRYVDFRRGGFSECMS